LKEKTVTIKFEADGPQRLDRFLSESLPELSRSYLQKLIADGLVRVDGAASKASRTLHGGETIEAVIPPPMPLDLEPQPIPLSVIYEDEHLIVVDKPAGMVVHPAPGHSGGTLVNALLAHCSDLSGIGGALRPGIVHRLDVGTSGLLVAAKSGTSPASSRTAPSASSTGPWFTAPWNRARARSTCQSGATAATARKSAPQPTTHEPR
jgi:23S rRNA-/tRNA-specific pseudouridylate synthase